MDLRGCLKGPGCELGRQGLLCNASFTYMNTQPTRHAIASHGLSL